MVGPADPELIRASSLTEALDAKAAYPVALPINGGTDVMVGLNFAEPRPPVILDISRVAELKEVERGDAYIRIGAGVTYTTIVDTLAADVPALAIAARTVGSPQIRNRGTLGGNLGMASPAGDSHPPLLAANAVYEVVSKARGTRTILASDFYVGPKRNVLETDELIESVLVPRAAGGQEFAKIGSRNAMVIAACSFSIVLDRDRRRVGTGIGSAGPTPLRAREAEEFLTAALDESGWWDAGGDIPASILTRFGELVADASRPIDDVRTTAHYRRHALRVMARRTARWACASTPGTTRGTPT